MAATQSWVEEIPWSQLELVQATGPRAIVAAPTSPRLSRRGAAQPEWARWLSSGAVMGFCREVIVFKDS